MKEAFKPSELFGVLHDLLAEESAENQRASERHDFQCVQCVAPFDGQSLPAAEAFFEVQCHDLSPQGFSFLSDEEPAYSELVVALGKEPCLHVVASVVRVTEKRASDGRHLVGCHFERRLE